MYELPKTERLCSRKQISTLMTEGKVLFAFPFKIFFSIAPKLEGEPCCRVAVNAPKRNFKRAVKRNLLKRRMREAFRKNKVELYDTLNQQNKAIIVFFHYVSPEILLYDDIESAIRKALSKLEKTVADYPDVPPATTD